MLAFGAVANPLNVFGIFVATTGVALYANVTAQEAAVKATSDINIEIEESKEFLDEGLDNIHVEGS